MTTRLPAPTFSNVHAVLQFIAPLPREPARDEAFIEAVRDEFPNVLTRQYLPAETPALTPHLVLASTSSQLALSAVQADFEVRFYGDYVTDFERGCDYVERKLTTVLRGLDGSDIHAMTVGVVATLVFSFEGRDGETPAAHIQSTHLRTTLDPDDLQDANVRVAIRLRDTYFVTFGLANFEARVYERPVMPGLNRVILRSWEGRVTETGLELSIDINNNLEARTSEAVPRVTQTGIGAVTRLLRELAMTAGPEFAESGTVSVPDLTTTSMP